MIPFPLPSPNPGGFDFFWQQLPWAIPSIFTFVVGMSLAFLGLFAIKRTEDRALLITYIMFCFGFGSLGMALSLRSVVNDLDLLLLLNRISYFGVVWLSPGAYLFAYYMTGRLYRSLLFAGILGLSTVAIAYFGLLSGFDFTGKWFHYSFGSYPIAELPLKIWGAYSSLAYLVSAVPVTIHYFLNHRDQIKAKVFLFLGLHFCSLLVITNLPSLSGIPIFPMSSFAFLPLLLLGYGIFRSDYLNLNDLLFKQRGLFKILAGLITFGLLGIAILAAITLHPTDHPAPFMKPVFLLPLFSGVCAFALAIFLAGSSPDQKLNMLGATSLMLAGAFMIVMTAFKLDLPLIVTRRIEQIFYTAFVFTPGVHLRFAYLALGKTRPHFVRWVDFFSVIFCVILWTPYFFSGFYEYWFGRISVAGIGLNAFGALGLIAAATFLISWERSRKTARNRLGSQVVLSLVIGDFLIFLNLPATIGIPLYPLGELQFIPAILLSFAIVKSGAIPISGEATAIGNRVSALILLFVPTTMLFYLLGLMKVTEFLPALAHTLLVAAPIALAFYMISFIFLRPTALKMDEAVRRLAEEKERANTALLATEEARQEIEALGHLTHLVNSHTDLNEIFNEISKYAYQKYGITSTWLFLPDEKNEHLTSFRASSYKDVSEELEQFVKNLKIPLGPDGGMAHLVWKRKRALYIPLIKKFPFEFDRKLIETTKATSFLHVPLVVGDQSIALMIFSNLSEPMNLAKDEIRSIETLCAQVAGVIHTVDLLRQTEKQKADTSSLNHLVKSLNENLDIQVIMEKVHSYVVEKFGIQYYSLMASDGEKSHLRLIAASLPDFVTTEERKRIADFKVPMKSSKGAHGLTLRSKKVAYFKDFDDHKLEWLTEEEKWIAKSCKIRSYLFLPLLLNQVPVGILNFSNSESMMNLEPEDLTRLSILGEQLAGIIYGSALFKEVQSSRNVAESERKKSEKLLLNILPADVASELKEKGATEPVLYENVSVMFTDFKGFTQIAEILSPRELIQDLDACFVQFDKITERFNLEKLKTIGDSYMCAGGIPKRNKTHALDSVLAALEIQAFMNLMKNIKEEQGLPYWELRLGIHTGPLVAGVIGEKKFAYDVWGDTVNTASRMESSGTPGKINISGSTYELIKEVFECEFRGYVNAKNKGEVAMYYVNGLKEEYATSKDRRIPNGRFWQVYADKEA
ncbi:guanylate cyclase [Leptospira ognonensis]|uniref:Adenylate cyclase n=1 Tax=Leptospira ognonensis TaxID=2484945 RepID=A0A4R9JXE0_9LEPT|nr:adenylate/guanylate cyclase domain-containing protein [Leptospira ognonensis]TGL57851.1 guanylate cyclase [Leptospira ognonensis]